MILAFYFLSFCFLFTRQQPQTHFLRHELSYSAKSSPPWWSNTSWIHELRQIFLSLGCFCWEVCPQQHKSNCYKTGYYWCSQTHAVTFNKPQCDRARRWSFGSCFFTRVESLRLESKHLQCPTVWGQSKRTVTCETDLPVSSLWTYQSPGLWEIHFCLYKLLSLLGLGSFPVKI